MLPRKRLPLADACCCHGGPPPASPPGRGRDIAAGALSLGVWALVPKCPMCLAAYVATGTGIGLSVAAATYLRWFLLLASAGMIAYVVAKQVRK